MPFAKSVEGDWLVVGAGCALVGSHPHGIRRVHPLASNQPQPWVIYTHYGKCMIEKLAGTVYTTSTTVVLPVGAGCGRCVGVAVM